MSPPSTPLASGPVDLFEVRVVHGVLLEVGESADALAAVLRRCDLADTCAGSVNRVVAVIAPLIGVFLGQCMMESGIRMRMSQRREMREWFGSRK